MAIISVFSDTHFSDRSSRSRVDYPRESLDLFDTILNEVKAVRRKYPTEKYYVLFGGDIDDRGYKDITAAIQMYQRFTILRSQCDGLIFVIGNHELTYRSGNLFWTMITGVSGVHMPVTSSYARGLIPLAKVCDNMTIEDVQLHFIHYGGSVGELTGKKNIVFIHDDYFCKDIIKIIEDKYDLDLKTQYFNVNNIDEGSPVSQMDAAFLFHNHKAYGTYDVEFEHGGKCRMYHLASLGRTTKDQVFDLEDTRLVPLIKISNGDYTVENRYIELPKAKDIIDIKHAEKVKQSYEKQKIRKHQRSVLLNGKDPVESIKENLRSVPEALEIFELAEVGKRPDWVRRLIE